MQFVLFLLPFIFVFLCPLVAMSVTPLYYHTHAVADMEAYVEGISFVGTAEVDTNQWMLRKSEVRSTHPGKVQKVLLRVLKVIRLEKKDSHVPSLAKGQSVEITNPFADQEPPFKTGDSIRVTIRLVLPKEQFDPQDPMKQWWFLPRGEPEGISAPRRPFEGVVILKNRRQR